MKLKNERISKDLVSAIKEDNLDKVKILANKKNVDNVCKHDWSALHYAIHFNKLNIVIYLIGSLNADLHMITDRGFSILHLCQSTQLFKYVYKKLEETKHFVKIINHIDYDATTPLTSFLIYCHEKKIQQYDILFTSLLARAEIIVNIREQTYGYAAIHFAVLLKDVQLIKAVSRNKFFNPNVQSTLSDPNKLLLKGDTALHLAIREGDDKIVEAILSLPYIRTDIKNSLGATPYKLAQDLGSKEIKKLFDYHISEYNNTIVKNPYSPFEWAASLDVYFESNNKQKPYKKVFVDGNRLHWTLQLLEYKEMKDDINRRIEKMIEKIDELSKSYALDSRLLECLIQLRLNIDQYKMKNEAKKEDEPEEGRTEESYESLNKIRDLLKETGIKVSEIINAHKSKVTKEKDKVSLIKLDNYFKRKIKEYFELKTNYVLAHLSFVVSDREHSPDGHHGYKVIHYPIRIKLVNYHDITHSHSQYNDDNENTDLDMKDFTKVYHQAVCDRFDEMNRAAAENNLPISKGQALASAEHCTQTSTAHSQFTHSETNLFYYLERQETIVLLEDFLSKNGLLPGAKVYAIIMDQLSTNYTCSSCTVQTLGVQNSHSNGFLKNFSDYMLERHYQVPKKAHGVRMITRISAEKEFGRTAIPYGKHNPKESFDIKEIAPLKVLIRDNTAKEIKKNTYFTYFTSGGSESKSKAEDPSRRKSSTFTIVSS